jgi:hypothetical protein
MLRIALLSSIVSSLLLTACGSDDKKLVDLSASEIRDLCEDVVELRNEQAAAGCRRDRPDAEVLANCISAFEDFPSTCQATRGQTEDCLDAQLDDLCSDDDHPECDAVDACED